MRLAPSQMPRWMLLLPSSQLSCRPTGHIVWLPLFWHLHQQQLSMLARIGHISPGVFCQCQQASCPVCRRLWSGDVVFQWGETHHTALHIACFWGCDLVLYDAWAPNHLRRLWLRSENKLGMPTRWITSAFVTLSCHLMCRRRLRQQIWKMFSRFSWLA